MTKKAVLGMVRLEVDAPRNALAARLSVNLLEGPQLCWGFLTIIHSRMGSKTLF